MNLCDKLKNDQVGLYHIQEVRNLSTESFSIPFYKVYFLWHFCQSKHGLYHLGIQLSDSYPDSTH